MKEETIKQFLAFVRLANQIQGMIADLFFSVKFGVKVEELSEKLFSFNGGENRTNVAQYDEIIDCINLPEKIDNLLDYLENLEHLKILDTSIPLLEFKGIMLRLKLETTKRKKYDVIDFIKKQEGGTIQNKNNKQKKQDTSDTKQVPKKMELTPSKKKILDFINSSPNIRTKEILYEFNMFSNRTVLRSLNELLKSGFINKKNHNRATHYFTKGLNAQS